MIIYMALQIITMYISTKIKINTFKKTYKSYGDKGFKINHKKMANDDYQPNNSKYSNALDLLCFLIPGVNIVNSMIRTNKTKKEFINRIDKNDALIPMSEEEKEYYDSIKNINEKIVFITYDQVDEDIDTLFERIKICLDDEKIVLKENIAQLYYDKLPPISYSLDEIKELSKSIESSYKLGKVDNVNTAIIGLPNEECMVNQVIFKHKDKLEAFHYHNLEEEDMVDEHFIVYPFGIDFEESDELKKCYQNIVDKRDNYKKGKRTSMILNEYYNDTKPFIRIKKSR